MKALSITIRLTEILMSRVGMGLIQLPKVGQLISTEKSTKVLNLMETMTVFTVQVMSLLAPPTLSQ